MIKITYKVNGRKVSPSNLKNELTKAVATGVDRELSRRVNRVRCPIHGQVARVVRSGASLRAPQWRVSGCCDTLVELAKQALG